MGILPTRFRPESRIELAENGTGGSWIVRAQSATWPGVVFRALAGEYGLAAEGRFKEFWSEAKRLGRRLSRRP